MNYSGKFDAKFPVDGSGLHSNGHVHVDTFSAHATQAPADAIVVPDAHLLFNGDFKRSGVDLVLSKDDQELVLHDYFKGEKRAALASPDGAHLTGDIVNALTGHVEYAQADGSASVSKIIGHVTKLAGTATAVRNGVSIILNQGDNVEKGDVVQSGSGSTLGITFIDGTVFGLSSNARMVLNEMVYDPNGSNNSSLLSLVAGTITFVAGETAKHGDMKIDTPVATMGIRGTAVLVEIDFDVPGQGGLPDAKFQVLVEPDGTTGSYILFDKTTLTPLAIVDKAGQQINISNGTLTQSSTGLSSDIQKLITDVFSIKFTDTNTKSFDHHTDTPIPDALLPIRLVNGITAIPVIVQVNTPVNTLPSNSVVLPSPLQHINQAPTAVILGPNGQPATNFPITERPGVTHSSALDTASGTVSFVDINVGDTPTVSTKFDSFTYQNAAHTDVTATLSALQLADIAAVEAKLTVVADPGNTYFGSATWTYSVADGAFDFLAAGETLTLTYTAYVDNNYKQSDLVTPVTFTITITGTNDVPVITSPQQNVNFVSAGTDTKGGELIPNTATAGKLTFTDPDLTDTHTVAVKMTSALLDGQSFATTVGPVVIDELAAALKITTADDSTGTGTGTVEWALANLQVYLADLVPANESLVLTYAVTVTDSQNATSTQDIVVTISGNNGAAVVWTDTDPIPPGGALWSVASNWEGDRVPNTPVGFNDDVFIGTDQVLPATPTFPVTVNATAAAKSLTMDYFTDFGTSIPELDVESTGTLTIAGALSLDTSTDPLSPLTAESIIKNYGNISVGGIATLLKNSVLDNYGTLTLDHGGVFGDQSVVTNSGTIQSVVTNSKTIEVGDGTLNVAMGIANSGGTLQVDDSAVLKVTDGVLIKLDGTMSATNTTISGGTLTIAGSGTLDIEKGTATLAAGTPNVTLDGVGVNGADAVTVSGTIVTPASLIDVGTTSVATLLLDDGTTITHGNLTIAGGSTLDVEAGTSGPGATLDGVGVSGADAVTVSGTIVTPASLIDVGTTSVATLLLDDGTTITHGNLTIAGGSTLDVEAGTSGPGATLDGVGVSGTDAVTVSGTIVTPASLIDVGTTSAATLLLDDGTTITHGNLTIGNGSTLDIEKGTTGPGATLDGVGVSGTDAVTVSGTIVTPASLIDVGTTSVATLLLDDGTTITHGNLTIGNGSTLDVEAGTSGPGATLDGVGVSGADAVTVSGTIVTPASLIDVGTTSAATLLLDDGTTITHGNLTIGSGSTLDIENSITGTGATLDGVAVTNSGTIQVDQVVGGPTTTVTLLLDGGTMVAGGKLLIHVPTSTEEGVVEIGLGGATLDDVTVDNNNILTIDSGVTLTLSGTEIIGGTINDFSSTVGGTIDVTGDSKIDGNAALNNGGVTVESGVTLTLDNMTVNGTTLTDKGTIVLDDTVKLTGGAILEGASTSALGSITNNGTLEVAGAASLLDDTLTNTSATGSILQVDALQTLTLSGTEIIGSTINDFSSTVGGTIDVTGDSKIDGNAALNNGGVTVESGVTLTLDNMTVNGTTLTDKGTIVLDDTVKLTGAAILEGASGSALGSITNNGTLEVAGAAELLDDTLTNTSASGSIIQVDALQTLTLSGTEIIGGTINDFSSTVGGTIDVTGDSKIDGNAALNNGGVTVESGVTLTLDNMTVNGTTLTDKGTIVLDDTVKLTGGAILEGASTSALGSITNNGTLEVAGAASLLDDTLTNTSATGSILQVDALQTLTLSGTEIIGGTINDNNTIDVTGDSKIDGNAALNNGGVTVESGVTLTLDNMTVNGTTLTDKGTIVLDDTVKLTGGAILEGASISAPGSITNNGTLEVAGAASLLDDTLTNTSASGSILQVDALQTLTLSGTEIIGGTITDNNTIDVTGDSKIDGNAALNNGGVTVESGVTLTLDNMTVNGTTLTDKGTIVLDDTVKLTGGAILEGASISALGSITNNGTLEVAGAAELLDDTLTNTSASGSILQVDALQTLMLSGTEIIGGTITNNGTIDVTGDSKIDGNATLNNGGVTVESGVTLTLDNMTVNGTTLTDKGTIVLDDTVKLTGAAILEGASISAPGSITNNGTLEVAGAAELLDDTLTNTSASGSIIQVDDGATLTLSGTEIVGGTINDGTVAGGPVASTGLIDVTGDSRIDGNANLNNGYVTVESGKTLTLDTMTVNGTTITDKGTIVLDDTVKLTGGATLEGASSSALGAITNNGTLEVAGAAELLDDTLTNTSASGSIIQVDDGATLTLSGTEIVGGTINDGTVAGGPVASTGLIDVTGDSRIDGNANLNNGYVTVESGKTLTLDTMTVNGTTITDKGTIVLDDTVKLTGGATLEGASSSALGAITNNGTLEVTGAAELLNDTLTNTSATGSIIQVDALQTLTLSGTGILGGTITDNGKIDVTGSSTINGNANLNNGAVTVESGKTLVLDNVTVTGTTFTDPGTIKVEAGQTLTLAGTDNITGGQFAIGDGKVQAAGNAVLLSGVSIGDLNTGNPVLTLTVTASGSITATSLAGLTIIGGLNGASGTLEVTGTLTAINAALASGLTYDPAGTSNTLTMTIDDGSGDTAFRTVTIDAPQGGAPSFQVTNSSGAIRDANLIDITGTTTLSSDEVFIGTEALTVEGTGLLKLIHSGTHGGTITDNGTIEIAGQSGINVASLNIGINGVLLVDSGKLLTVNNSTVTGGTVTDNGTIEITTSSAIDSASLSNGGVTVDANQTLTLDDVKVNGTVFTDTASGAILQIESGDTLAFNGATINGGTLTITGELDSTGTSFITGATIINSSHIDVVSGTLTIDPTPVTNTGTIEVKDDSTLVLSGETITNSVTTAGVTTKGIIQVDATDLAHAHFSTLDLEGSTINGGTVTISGELVSTGDSFITGATIGNTGTIDVTGGTLTIDATSTLNNTGGTLETDGGNLIIDAALSGNLEIKGSTVLELGASSPTAYLSATVTFEPGATGTLKLDHSETFGGTVVGLDDNKIDLGDIAYGSNPTVSYAGTASGGILSVFVNGVDVSNIHLTGDYLGVHWTLADDGSSQHGTVVMEVPGAIAGLDSNGNAVQGVAVTALITDGGQTVSGATYDWQVSNDGGKTWVDASGTNGLSSYTPVEADEGQQLRVALSFTDSSGQTETSSVLAGVVQESLTDDLVATFNHATAQQGVAITVTGVADGGIPVTTGLSYVWEVSNGQGWTTVGGNTASYTPTEADEGKTLQLVVTDAGDPTGSESSTYSFGTVAESATDDLVATFNHTTAQQGVAITVTGVADGGIPVTTGLSYVWEVSDGHGGWTPVGGNTASYTPTEGDEGKTLQLVVTDASDPAGSESSTYNFGTVAESAANDLVATLNTTTAQQGVAINVTKVTDGGITVTTGLTYLWEVSDGKGGWTPVGGNTASYTPTEGDEGKTLQLVVTYVDAGGSESSIYSLGMPNDLTMTVDSTYAKPGATIHVTGIDDGGTNIPTSSNDLSYTWQVSNDGGHTWTTVGTNSESYMPTSTDAGDLLQVVVTYVDSDEHESVTTSFGAVATKVWSGGSHDWQTASHWSPSGAPGSGDDVVVDASGNYTVTINQAAEAHSLIVNDSHATVEITGSNTLTLGGNLTIEAGHVQVDSGATLKDTATFATITGAFTDNGTIEAGTGSTLEIASSSSDISGAGKFKIDAGAALQLDHADSLNVAFTGSGVLILNDPTHFTGTISDSLGSMTAADVLDLHGFAAATTTASTGNGSFNRTTGTTTLTVTDSSDHLTETFTLAGNLSNSTWTVTDDGHGGANIVDPPGISIPVAATNPAASSTIVASGPNQILTGNAASDTFAFNFAGVGHTTVTDFHPTTDMLQFNSQLFANVQAALNATHDDGHGNTVVALDAHDTITLSGVLKAQLHASDFHFV